jgi:hypothetical protein
MEQIVNNYRPIILKYFATKRTISDAKEFFETHIDIEHGKDLLDIFMVMSNDNNELPKSLKDAGRKLTIGILRYPSIDFDLLEVIDRFKSEIAKFVSFNKGIELGNLINKTCSDIDLKYWNRMLEDMETGYYDDFIKNLLVVRNELLANLDGSAYTKESILDAIDLEFIKGQMYNNTYRFMGLFNFIQEFILDRLHRILKETFVNLCDNFSKDIGLSSYNGTDDLSNTTSIKLLRFIVNNMIEFLYLDVDEY